MRIKRFFRGAAIPLALPISMLISLTVLIARSPAQIHKVKKAHAAKRIDVGRNLFAQACSSCHGSRGQGGDGPDLRAIRLDSDGIEAMIRRGEPGEMPSFATRFQRPDLDSLAAYVKALKR